MSNSPLVTYTNLTSNKNSPRNHAIDTITIHCYVGQVTAKEGCDYFATTTRQVSSNYVIGKDGSIGLSVEEKDRSWCSSNSSNDHRAITIEVASDTKDPYKITDSAYKALIDLLVDICQRNEKLKSGLRWKGDESLVGIINEQNMTVHRWFATKSCPGDYLYNLHSQIAKEVNERLNPVTVKYTIKKGDIVKLTSDATYYNGKSIPNWVKYQTWIVDSVSGDRVIIDKNELGTNSICSPIHARHLVVAASVPFAVKVAVSNLSMRTSPSSLAPRIAYIPKGVYTIVETDGNWGKLKSKQMYNGKKVYAWIHLGYVTKL